MAINEPVPIIPLFEITNHAGAAFLNPPKNRNTNANISAKFNIADNAVKQLFMFFLLIPHSAVTPE